MALCKAMILVGALLLVPTFQKRIILDQANKFTLSETEEAYMEMIEHQNSRAMESVPGQGELAEAPAEAEVHEEKMGKVAEDAVDEGTAALGGAVNDKGASVKEGAAKKQRAKTAGKNKKGKEKKGKGEGEGNDEGEDKRENGKDKGKEKGENNGKMVASGLSTVTRFSYLRGEFLGYIYKEIPTTKDLVIKCWKAHEEFGREALLPLASNSVGAKVGDKISFDVEELVQVGKGKPKPMAVHVLIRSGGHALVNPKNSPLTRGAYRDASGFLTITHLSFVHAQFTGFIYQKNPRTKTLLIACWKAHDEFGAEAIIPLWSNSVRAEVGDKISFDVEDLVQEGEGKPRPMATNLLIRSRGWGKDVPEVAAPSDVCTQILYYLSDRNLRKDKFFQEIIAQEKGGWISADVLLGCRRIKQLAASKKSIIECLQDAPGVEVRDTPGKEAVRRTSPPPPLESTVSVAVVGQQGRLQSAGVPALVKKTYSNEAMKLWGDGPQVNKQELALVIAEAEGPEATVAESEGGSRRSTMAKTKKEGKVKEAPKKATEARQAAADKPVAKKSSAEKFAERKQRRKENKSAKKAEEATAEKAVEEEEDATATETDTAPKKEAQKQKAVAEKSAAYAKAGLPQKPMRRGGAAWKAAKAAKEAEKASAEKAVEEEEAATSTETAVATE